MLWVLIIVLFAAFAFCVWGFTLSLKQRNKTKALQKTADYNFKTKNGSYSFIYTIKGFQTDLGKEIKVALQPVLGFSDIAAASTNQCVSVKIEAVDVVSGRQIIGEEKFIGVTNTLNVNDSILIPNELLSESKTANVTFTVISSWNLGKHDIDEKLEFNFNK